MRERTVTGELILRDASSSQAVLMAHFPIGTEATAAAGAMMALAAAVAPCTGCAIVGLRLKYAQYPDSASPADSDAAIKRAGVFFFATDTGENETLVSVPGIRDSALVVSGPGAGVLIDTTSADVAAFVASLVDNGACDPFGHAIISLLSAYRQSRT